MKSESNTFAQTGIRAQGIPSALTCQAKLKEIGQRGIYNLIRRLATTLIASMKQRSCWWHETQEIVGDSDGDF